MVPLYHLSLREPSQQCPIQKKPSAGRRSSSIVPAPSNAMGSLQWTAIFRIIILVSHILVWAGAEPCSPCPNSGDNYDPLLSGTEVNVPGFGVLTCGLIESALPGLRNEGDADCVAIQSLGSFCGCPVKENSCGGLCEGYNKDTVIPNLFGYQDYTGKCELVNSFLESFTNGTNECDSQRYKYFETCGCQPPAIKPENTDDGNAFDGNDSPSQERFPFTVCWDGSPVGFPDKDMAPLLLGSPDNPMAKLLAPVIGNSSFSCEFSDNLARQGVLPPEIIGTAEHQFFGGVCGCPPVKDACEFCPTNDVDSSDDSFPLGSVVFDIEVSCLDTQNAMTQIGESELRCWNARHMAFLCGCNGGTAWYLGANSEPQQKTLAWIPRITGFFSFVGSVYIIQDILREVRKSRINNGFSTYQLILLGMSIFDISSSIAWMVSSAAIPEYDEERESDSGAYGANGNQSTCTAQGFFLELGFVGSTAFTASLTTFYVLTIIYGYRESKMKPLQKYFMAVPSVIALALASAAIPFYQPFHVACFVSNPNTEVDGGSYVPLIFFSILPVGISILISIGNLAAILQFVVNQNKKADKWRFASQASSNGASVNPGSSNLGPQSSDFTTPSSQLNASSPNANKRKRRIASKTEKAVFWQAFWYVMAFLLTWVIYLIGQFKPYFSTDDTKLYSFWVTLLILNPLMGFWNAFVYVKPWTWELWGKLAGQSCCRRTDANANPTSSHATGFSGHSVKAQKDHSAVPPTSHLTLSDGVVGDPESTHGASESAPLEVVPEGAVTADNAVTSEEDLYDNPDTVRSDSGDSDDLERDDHDGDLLTRRSDEDVDDETPTETHNHGILPDEALLDDSQNATEVFVQEDEEG